MCCTTNSPYICNIGIENNFTPEPPLEASCRRYGLTWGWAEIQPKDNERARSWHPCAAGSCGTDAAAAPGRPRAAAVPGVPRATRLQLHGGALQGARSPASWAEGELRQGGADRTPRCQPAAQQNRHFVSWQGLQNSTFYIIITSFHCTFSREGVLSVVIRIRLDWCKIIRTNSAYLLLLLLLLCLWQHPIRRNWLPLIHPLTSASSHPLISSQETRTLNNKEFRIRQLNRLSTFAFACTASIFSRHVFVV